MSTTPLDPPAGIRLALVLLIAMGMGCACGPAGGPMPAVTQAAEATPGTQGESPAELQQCQNAVFLPLSLVNHFASGMKLPEGSMPSQPVIESPSNGSLLPPAPVTLTYRLGSPPSPDYRYSVSITFGRVDEVYLHSETTLPSVTEEADYDYVWTPPSPGNYYALLTVKSVLTDGAPSPAVKDIVAEGGSNSLFLCFKISTGAVPAAPAALTCADRAAMLSEQALGPLWGFDPALPAPPDPVITQPSAEAILSPGAVRSAYRLGAPASADLHYRTTTLVANTRDMTIKGLFDSFLRVRGESGLAGSNSWMADSPGTYLILVWSQYVKTQGPPGPDSIVARGPYSYGFSCFTVK